MARFTVSITNPAAMPSNRTTPAMTSFTETITKSNDVYATLEVVINCYVIEIVAAFGIVGNVFNIVVLSKHGMHDSTNILLNSLSVIDLIFVITTAIRRAYCLFIHTNTATATTLMAADRAFLSVANRVTGIISSAHIVLISIERAVAVYFPFHVSIIFSPFKTKIYLSIIYLYCIAQGSPYLFAYDFYWGYDPKLNTTVGKTRLSTFYTTNIDGLQWFNTMIISNLRGPVFIIIIVLCSVLIGIRLYQASIKRAKMSSTKSGVDVKVVKMLLTVSLTYLAVGVPVHTFYMFFYYSPEDMREGSELSPLYLLLTEHVSDLFYTINASVNFIIYVGMSQKFYNTWKQLITYKRK